MSSCCTPCSSTAASRTSCRTLEWLRYPSTMLLNSRGCSFNCAICDGSRSAYAAVAVRSQAAMRSPEKLVADAILISTFSRAPMFMVHMRVGGLARRGLPGALGCSPHPERPSAALQRDRVVQR